VRFVNYLGAGLALACLTAPISGANAQGIAAPTAAYAGVARTAPGCPHMSWHIQRVPGSQAGTLAGVAWFVDMSGVSSVRGAVNQAGAFTLTVTSVSGTGPSGTVTGTRGADGSIRASLDGPGCSKLQLLTLPSMNIPQSGMGG